MSICSVAACPKPSDRRGWCTAHYMRWHRHGDPLGGRGPTGAPHKDQAGYMVFTSGPYAGRREHTVVAEKAFGKPLPAGVVVHHVDEDKANNYPSNLVICQSHAYHFLLHTRADAIAAGHPATWRKCGYCSEYDALENMRHYQYKNVNMYQHKKCSDDYNTARR